VPANPSGSYEFDTAQLKTIQEVIALTVFAVFSVTDLVEKLSGRTLRRLRLPCSGAFFVFLRW
jgi:Uncharacterized protein conserved in bacteria